MPSRGRPDRVQALLDTMVALGSVEPGVVWCNADDAALPAYLRVRLPMAWHLRILPDGHRGIAEPIRTAFDEHRGDPWFGLITDDIVIGSAGFERALIDAAGAWGIASSNDHLHASADVSVGRMNGAIVFGGDLLRALGYWLPPGFRHLYVDDVWETVGRRLGNWRCLMAIDAAHDQPPDAVSHQPAAYAEDRATFRTWLAEEAAIDIMRARMAQWQAQGLSLERARQRSVMLAFPVYDKPHHQHEASAMATVGLLAQLGIRQGFAHAHHQPTHSARNMLVAQFLATDLTDLLFVDSDMSWEPFDVVRLLASRHPFIGGVGRRRGDHHPANYRAWCFGALDAEPAHDAAGAFEVKHLGTGFLLINRLVFEAIERHGAPVKVSDSDKVSHTRFFYWDHQDGEEIGEDTAMCRSYRAIGGKVMLDPTIELRHFDESERAGRLIDFIT